MNWDEVKRTKTVKMLRGMGHVVIEKDDRLFSLDIDESLDSGLLTAEEAVRLQVTPRPCCLENPHDCAPSEHLGF